ncbi:MAG TPA: D-amino-acid transaminase [Sulfurovum sp.]|nr:D-amino-acid transaminase [Sulfurovum sp.]
MSKIVFLNGEYMEADEAKVSIFDRGYLFGDGVYEVVPVIGGRMIDKEPFLERFERSLAELELEWPMPKDEFLDMFQELIERNNIKEGGIYTQVTRGVHSRVFDYPKGIPTTVTAFTFEKNIIDSPDAKTGVKVAIVEDIRWKRRDIKSIALLGQCMAKEQASKQGAYEGWMTEFGFITEGVTSTAYIVKDGVIITRALSNSVLPGIRRKLLLELAIDNGIKVKEKAFTPQEAYEADEAFLSSATTLVYPIIEIDGKPIGDGKPGKITKLMREIYIKSALEIAGIESK